MAVEDIVLFFLGALCALQAADEEDSHSRGDYQGDDRRASRKPLSQTMHTHYLLPVPFSGSKPPKLLYINYDAILMSGVCTELNFVFSLA